MKRLLDLWIVLATECGEECSTSVLRDIRFTVVPRLEHEGVSFFTITLPTFCQSFERAIEVGCVDSSLFQGFSWKGGLPKFLRGFLRQVFDEATGRILPRPDAKAVRCIRQLCLLYKKVELDCTTARTERAITGYELCDREVGLVNESLDSEYLARLRTGASVLFGDVFNDIARLVDEQNLTPRHGSGATADRLFGNQKFGQSEWTDRLEHYFPFGRYVSPNWTSFISSESSDVTWFPVGSERPVKVTTVPKTLKAPRIIAEEPACMQFIQQGLMSEFMTRLEASRYGYLTGFTRQSVNQEMARIGSVDGSLATLDLSEASDRVPLRAVEAILSPWPSLLGAVMACRSRTAKLPDGRIITLEKFASMGSALCFVFEEIVFITAILVGIADAQHKSTKRAALDLKDRFVCYGDDIVVPVDMVDVAIESLHKLGLKVNASKSFWNGKFRESCGADWFAGEWVTPVRVTQPFPDSTRSTQSIVSTMELSNRLYLNGYWRSSRNVLDMLQALGYGLQTVPWGTVTDTAGTPAVAPVCFQSHASRVRWDNRYHRWSIKTHVLSPKKERNEIDGVAALRKTLSGSYADPSYADHLLYSGRPSVVNTKLRSVGVVV